MRTIISTLLLVGSAFVATATTYDIANQTDFDNFNCAVLMPGDVVRLARGQVFYGQLDICQNSITVTAYGTGADPVISGEKNPASLSWTNYSGNIWYASLSASPNSVFVDDVQATRARYPNSGYRTVTSATASTMTDASLTYDPGWTGAGIHIRTSNWTWENRSVTSYNSSTKTFSYSNTTYVPAAGFAYYLDNKFALLDSLYEWYFDASTLRLYIMLPSAPTNYTIGASIYNYGIACSSNANNIAISEIQFKRQKRNGVEMTGTSANNNSITYCTFDGQYETAVNISGSYITVSHCSFQNQNGRAIFAQDLNYSTLTYDTLQDIGQIPGYGISGDAGLAGIAIYVGTENYVSHNVIDNIGYIGIILNCDNSLCEYNQISNCMTKTSDGCGIKCYGPISHHNVIRYNLVSACSGDPSTTPYTDFLTSAIYLDFYCHDNRVDSNVIFDQPKAGIQINKDNTFDTIRGNIVFGSKMGIMFLSSTVPGEEISDCLVRRNVFYCLDPAGAPVLITNMGTSGLPGTLDSNYYCAPWKDTVVLRRLGMSTYLPYNLSAWQAASGQDAHSVDSYYSWAYPENHASLELNDTYSPITITPGASYVDLDDNPVTSFTLPPFSGKVIIENLALPVEWLSPLRATVLAHSVRLDWVTANEERNDRFRIERSHDGRQFQSIGEVKAKSESGPSYQFLDESPLVGINYYRLRQVDVDGRNSYSNVVAAEFEPDGGFKLYPNPTGSDGMVYFELQDDVGQLLVLDAKGKAVHVPVSDNRLDFSSLPAGLYFVLAQMGSEWVVKKMVR